MGNLQDHPGLVAMCGKLVGGNILTVFQLGYFVAAQGVRVYLAPVVFSSDI